MSLQQKRVSERTQRRQSDVEICSPSVGGGSLSIGWRPEIFHNAPDGPAARLCGVQSVPDEP